MISMILSLIILILSDSRPLVEVEINGRPAVMLVDTGSSVGVIHTGDLSAYGISVYKSMNRGIIGVNSDNYIGYYIRNANVNIHGVRLYQFIAYDISAIKESIRYETGKDIVGIIGYDQIRSSEMMIDLSNNLIQLGYGK